MTFLKSQTTAHETLDCPAWAALSSRQSAFGQSTGKARAFLRDVAPFAAVDPEAAQVCCDLVDLVATRPEGIVIMQVEPQPTVPGVRVAEKSPGVQMIAKKNMASKEHPSVQRLSSADIPGMLALVALTKPGPFKRRTFEIGQYFGILAEGHLVAMAGERMKLPGYTEISAVCTHPHFRGRGYAAALVSHVARRIEMRGEVPFLHTYASNTRAIALYRELGFELRCMTHITRLVCY
ncbi:MAG: GNAT family N-acetyltransferase [Pseudomonadota bacterium]